MDVTYTRNQLIRTRNMQPWYVNAIKGRKRKSTPLQIKLTTTWLLKNEIEKSTSTQTWLTKCIHAVTNSIRKTGSRQQRTEQTLKIGSPRRNMQSWTTSKSASHGKASCNRAGTSREHLLALHKSKSISQCAVVSCFVVHVTYEHVTYEVPGLPQGWDL